MSAVRPYRPLAQVRAVGGPYVDQVVADFRALPPEVAAQPRYQEARALAEQCDELDWRQLFTLELWVLQLMPLYQLEQRAAVLGEIFARPPSPRPQPDEDDYAERLRAWALNLQSERQWVFRKNLLLEQEGWRLRRRLAETWLATSVAALLLGWVTVLLGWGGVGVLALAGWLGVTGAYVSIARRIQSGSATRPGESSRGTAFGNLCALDVGQDTLVQAMLFGGVFAWIGYGLLASGLLGHLLDGGLNSVLLPQFSIVGLGAAGLELGWPQPAGERELVKLAVWCFVFGFAERLVPGVLDKLSGKLNKDRDRG